MHIAVTEISKKLISLGLIKKAGWSFVGKNGYLSIYDPNGKLFLKTANRNSIYPIQGMKTKLEANANVEVNPKSLGLWHERCANVNVGVIYRTIKTKTVFGVDNVQNGKRKLSRMYTGQT